MKKYFRIFIILSTFATPAFSAPRTISPALAEARLEKYCDSQGYRVFDNDYNKYVASLGEVTTDCESSPAIATIGCYTYKKMNTNIEKEIQEEFAPICGSKKITTVKILSDLQRPASHLSIEEQKQECEKFDKNKWNGTECVCKDDVPPNFEMQNGRCSLTQQGLDKLIYERECEEADGTVIDEKCKCNDSEQIYDPKTKSCIPKTANYDAALNILNTLNNTLDTTMAKFNKPQE